MTYQTDFETLLSQLNHDDWNNILNEYLPSIHRVDQIATQVWFKFFPLALHQKLQSLDEEERAKFIQKQVIQGKYELKDQVDSSHYFLYGHRFWGETKHAIANRAKSFLLTENNNLKDEINQLIKAVAPAVKVDESVVTGIVLVGLMTLQQVGLDNFNQAKGEIFIDRRQVKKSPEQVLDERAKDDSQGLFSFLKTVNKQWTVTYNENYPKDNFKAFNQEELASAAAKDNSKNWLENDFRCGDGPIPVECRSASCGTCWVGVLGGAEKLSEISSLESKRMKVFGYDYTEETHPFMRLSCQAKATGAVSIVIPPWNGVFGKALFGDKISEVELEANTTSAAKLRETLAKSSGNE